MQSKAKRQTPNAKRTITSTPKFTNSFSPETLLPTAQIIKLATAFGVDFGPGNPLERIRYFIKLGILPHAVRKIPHIQLSNYPTIPSTPTGHLPYSSVKTLIDVDRMYRSGVSYPQIAAKIGQKETPKRPTTESSIQPEEAPSIQKPIDNRPAGINLFPRFGVTEDAFAKKLHEHEKSLARLLDKKLSGLTQPQPQTQNLFESNLVESPKRKSKLSFALKTLVVGLTITGLASAAVLSGQNYFNNIQTHKNISNDINNSKESLGQVLAATSAEHKLYIDADTQVSGTTLFAENITAPNVLYGANAGTGITVSAGQTPTISLAAAVVTGVNSLAGGLTISGSGSTTVSSTGSTITISSTGGVTSEADTLATVTGRGATTTTAVALNGGLTSSSATPITLSSTTPTVSIGNTGTLSITDGTNTLFSVVDSGSYGTIRLTDKGSTGDPATCTSGDIYFNATDTTVKACTATNTWEALDGGGATAGWTDGGTEVYLTTTTDEVIIGGTTVLSSAKLSLDGDSDQIQLIVQGFSTQTSSLAVFEQSDGTDVLTISNAGLLTTASNVAVNGGDITTTSATFNLANAAATLNLGSTNVTRSINIGTGTNADTIAIGTGGTNADTITIGTGTVANSITIGTTTASSSLALNDDNWNITGAGAANFASIGATTAGSGTFTNLTATGNITFSSAQVLGASPLVFEGGTDDNVTTTLAFTDPTSSNKTITFPNATGTVAVSATSPVTLSALGDIGCSTCIVSGGSIFTAAADSSSVSVTQGSTLTLAGGTNGIDTAASGSTITFNFDSTEVGTTTWGSGSAITWTFDASGGTDPTFAFASSSLTIGSAATIVSDQATLALFNTTTTTLSIGGAATTALNIGNGNTAYTAINIGSGTGGNIINIAGTGATGADTINIGTGGTAADTINIGSSASTTSIGLTTGTGSQTFASSVATTATTSSAFVFTANSISSGTGVYLNSTGTITGKLVDVVANSLTSGKIIDISASSTSFSGIGINFTGSSSTGITGKVISLTSDIGSAGRLIDLAPDFSGSAVTGYGIYQAATDSTTNGNTNYGIFNSLTLTGNAAKVGVGTYNLVSSNSTTADTLIGEDLLISATGALSSGTRNTYGLRSQPASTADSSAGTLNLFGGYFAPSSTLSSTNSSSTPTNNVYGIYTSNTATVDNDCLTNCSIFSYGVFVANGTSSINGTSTKYGVYLASQTNADTNYGIYSAGGNMDFELGASQVFNINTTSNTIQAGGIIALTASSSTAATNQYGIYDNYTLNNTGGEYNFGILTNITQGNSTGASTAYGQAIIMTDAQGGNNSGIANSSYGLVVKSTITGDVNNSSGKDAYGIYADISNDNTTTDQGIRNTWGGFFKATGSSRGTSNAYGVYALVASGADADYGLYGSVTDSTSAGNKVYGAYLNVPLTGNAAKTGIGIYGNLTTNSSTLGNTYGQYLVVNDTGATSSGSKIVYGQYIATNDTGATAGTTRSFGVYSITTDTHASNGGINGAYGGYFNGVGTDAGASNTSVAYGIYATASGADTNVAALFDAATLVGNTAAANFSGAVALQVRNQFTTSSLCSAGCFAGLFRADHNESGQTAASHYALYTQVINTAGTITDAYGIYQANPTNTGTAITDNYGIYLESQTAGSTLNYGIYIAGADTNAIYSTQSSSVSGNSSININYTFNSTTTSAIGYGIYKSFTHSNASLTTNNTLYGDYLTFSDTTALANTNYGIYATLPLTGNAAKTAVGIYSNLTTNSTTKGNTYGQYNIVSDTGGTSTGTKIVYGSYISTNDTGATAGTTLSYGVYGVTTDTHAANGGINGAVGAYFSAVGTDAGASNTSLAYGVYATASGADTNYAGYFSGDTVITGHSAFGDQLSSTNAIVAMHVRERYVSTDDCGTNGCFGSILRIESTSAGGTNPWIVAQYVQTIVNSGTIANSYGAYIANPSNSGTITNNYGIYLESQTAGGTLNYGIYVGGASGGATANYGIYTNGGKVQFNCTTSVTTWTTNQSNPSCSDYAETYDTNDNSLEPGDIVAIDTQNSNKVAKSTNAYQNNLVGIYSTSPGILIGPNGIESAGGQSTVDSLPQGKIPVALTGRVPLKVNDENGPIQIGDLLTSSSTPGVAMRADPTKGSTIGKALEGFSGPGEGKILVFVETNTRYNLADALKDTDLQAQSLATTSGNFSVDNVGNVTTGGTLSAAGGLFTVDNLGNLNAQSLNANQLNIAGDAVISGSLSASSVVTSQISALNSQDLNIRLGDSLGATSLNILDSIGNSLFTINTLGDATFSGVVRADAFETNSSADLAEKFASADSSVEAGDIVAVDENNKEQILPSRYPYQPTILGIVSTEPGLTLNSTSLNSIPLALAGRVPTKVSTENGPIKAGDAITSSSTPGVGMRATAAGRVVGIALEDFDGTTSSPCHSDPELVEGEESLHQKTASNEAASSGSALVRGPEFSPANSLAENNSNVNPSESGGTGNRTPGTRGENSVPHQATPTPGALCAKIVVFVNPSWYLVESLATNGSLANTSGVSQDTSSHTPEVRLGSNQVNADGTLASSSPTTGAQMSDEQIKQLVHDEVSRQLVSLRGSTRIQVEPLIGQNGQIDSPIPSAGQALGESTTSASSQTDASPSASLEASSSADVSRLDSSRLANQTQQTLDELNKLMATTDLSLSTLTVTGITNLAQTQVAGTFSQDGTLIIDYGKQVNVLGSTLYLQNDPLAGCLSDTGSDNNDPVSEVCQNGTLIDIGNSKFTFDRSGGLKIKGQLTASSVQTKELTIDTSSENARTAGTATITSGKNSVTIFTTSLKPNAKVLVTASGPTGGRQLYVSAKSDFEGFTVALDGNQAQQPIEFDWLIVNTSLQSKL